MEFRWQHIQYEDGSNPYICTTEKEFNRIKRKYGKRLQKIQEGFWYVRDREKTNGIEELFRRCGCGDVL